MDRGLDFQLTSPDQNGGPGSSPNRLPASSRNWFRLVVAGLAIFNFSAGAFIGVGYRDSLLLPLLQSAVPGLFTAQAGLLTLWLVWGPGRFDWRLLVHWHIVLGFSLALLAGFAISHRGPMTKSELMQNYGIALAVLPALSLGLQLPLWPLRVYGGLRVDQVADDPARPATAKARDPLAIRDLLLGTLLVALALGGIRAAVVALNVHRTTSPSEFLVGCLIGLIWLMLIALLGLLPALFLLLRLKNTSEAVSLWFGYVSLLLIGNLLMTLVQGLRVGEWYRLFPSLISFGSFATTLGLPLLLARRDGWRLRLPWDKPDAAS